MEPNSLPIATIECRVCFNLVVNAVYCVQCKQFLCDRHSTEVRDCPFCRAAPFRVEIDHSIRRLVDQLPIRCLYCHQSINKGDFDVHVNHCPQRPRNCGFKGCGFQTVQKEEGLRHLMESHGEILWEKYNKLTESGNNLLLSSSNLYGVDCRAS